MSPEAVSPLRQRKFEDMTIRQFGEHTQRDYIREVREFTAFLGRSPERQLAAEARPNEERRTEIATDQAFRRLARKVCLGCERPVDLANPDANFCPHCRIGIFERCPACSHRKSTFEQFCYACGTAAGTATPRLAMQAATS